MRYLLIILTALSGLSALPVRAQDAEATQLVNEILDATDALKRGQEVMPFMLDQMGKLFVSTNPDKGPQIAKLLKEDFGPRFIARFPEIRPDMVALYVKTYTLEEIRFMHTNATSAMGRSITAKQAQMMPVMLQVSQVFAQRLAGEILQEMAPKFRENGIKL